MAACLDGRISREDAGQGNEETEEGHEVAHGIEEVRFRCVDGLGREERGTRVFLCSTFKLALPYFSDRPSLVGSNVLFLSFDTKVSLSAGCRAIGHRRGNPSDGRRCAFPSPQTCKLLPEL